MRVPFKAYVNRFSFNTRDPRIGVVYIIIIIHKMFAWQKNRRSEDDKKEEI